MTFDEIGGLFGALVLLVLFGVLIYHTWLRHHLNYQEAKRSFPGLAQELGLRYRKPKDAKQIGVLSGVYDGYRVKIDADSNFEKFTVRLRFTTSLTLSMDRWESENDSFASTRLNLFFRTREASPELLLKLHERREGVTVDETGAAAGYRQAAGDIVVQPSAAELLDAFVGRWKGKLKRFQIVRSDMQCAPLLGSNDESIQSLSAGQVYKLLPELIELARAIDGLAPQGAVERE